MSALGSGVRLHLISVDVDALRPLFGNDFGCGLLLVTSAYVRRRIKVLSGTVPVDELEWVGPSSCQEMLGRIKSSRRAILWIADAEFEHVERALLSNGKLAAVSLFSDIRWEETLPETWKIVTDTDYEAQLRTEAHLINLFQAAKRVVFASPRVGEAFFECRRARHWFSLHGPLGWGDQAVLPTGELSALTDQSGRFSPQRFEFNGIISLHGVPIIHRGSEKVPLGWVDALAKVLAPLACEEIAAVVRHGLIEEVRALSSGGTSVAAALEQLLNRDARYRRIHEVGFGSNPLCRQLRAGNCFSNERYPGVHLGIGLGGHTEFHIDLVCADVRVQIEALDGTRIDIYNEHPATSASDGAHSTGTPE